MTSTLRDQLLPRSIRPSTFLSTVADEASRPLDSQSPYSPRPNRNKKHRDIFSLRRCLSRKASSTTPQVQQEKKKKKSRKSSITGPTMIAAQNTAAAFALLEQAPPILRRRSSKPSSTRLKAPPPNCNPLMQWLKSTCPRDVVPKIMAFCGPQTTATLGQCNLFWRDLVASEETWRVLCEELYKVRHFYVQACCCCSFYFFLFYSFSNHLSISPPQSGEKETRNRIALGVTFIV